MTSFVKMVGKVKKDSWLVKKNQPLNTPPVPTPRTTPNVPTPTVAVGEPNGRRQATAGTGQSMSGTAARVSTHGSRPGSPANPIPMPKQPIGGSTPIPMPKQPVTGKPQPVDQVNPGRAIPGNGNPSITGTTAGGMGRLSAYDYMNPNPRRSLK